MGNGTITMTGAEYDALAGKIATLEADNAKLRAELERRESDGRKLVPVEPTPELREALRQAIHAAPTHPLAELLNRCYVALGEQQVQEGQYDDELHEAWQSRLIGLIKSYRAADDGSEVRDVFRAITAHIEVQPMSMTMLPAEAQAGLALQRNEIDRLKQQLRAEGDRIAELRQDALDMTSALGDAHSENYRILEELRAWKLRAFAPATVQGDGWIPVSERLPESERTVLAFYLNSNGKGRRVRAEYIAAKTKSADDGWDSDEPADYDEQADEYFWPAGWYEVMDNWDDLTHMVIHEGEVTHWMPLPESPAIAAARKGEV